MYEEDDLLSLSGIQHFQFCKRQCALIHIEQQWSENFFTAEGRLLHEKVHSDESETRGDKRIQRGLRLRSLVLGVTGQADVVEFYKDGTVRPVEYKRGKPKPDITDEVQLCAQAMCLEEMLNVHISEGDLFYGTTRRRKQVVFDDELRRMTAVIAEKFHTMVKSGITPEAEVTEKCDCCSLAEVCLPESSDGKKSVKEYINRMLRKPLGDSDDDTECTEL